MTRWLSLALLASALATAALTIVFPRAGPLHVAPGPSVAPTPIAATIERGAPGLLGVQSCAATACHGRPLASEPSLAAWDDAAPFAGRGRELAAWANHDPHARAYSTLGSERSRDIVERLATETKSDGDTHHAVLRERCFGCHTSLATAPAADLALAAEGVSCEACHGPASRWVAQHTTAAWAVLAPSERFSPDTGLFDTDSLAGRAAVCAKCHVGAPAVGEGESLVRRDVDHDLIAAGHPRLHFDFHAYLAALPPHWDRTADAARHGDYAPQAWVAGQLASAQAALELLHYRAAGAPEDSPAAGRPVWPELAEYDCYACHRELSRFVGAGPSLVSPVGAPPWGGWYLSAVEPLFDPANPQDGAAWREALSRVANEMSRPVPDRRQIVAGAESLRTMVDRLSARRASAGGDPRERLNHHVANHPPPERWEQAALFWLAAAALADQDESRQQALAAYRELLSPPASFAPQAAASRERFRELQSVVTEHAHSAPEQVAP